MSDFVTLLVSSGLIAGIVSAVIGLLTGRKKDIIENITKERKTWREEIRGIADKIAKADNNLRNIKSPINKLKVRFNPKGNSNDPVFDDVRIWEQFEYYDRICQGDFVSTNIVDDREKEKIKQRFINFISCLLKYDWEKTKSEIRGKTHITLVIVALIASFVSYIAVSVKKYTSLIDCLPYCVLFCVLSAIVIFVVWSADRWRSRLHLWIYVVLPGIAAIVINFFLCYHVKVHLTDYTDYIIIFAPCLTMLSVALYRILDYSRSVRALTVAIAYSVGSKVVSTRYAIFFRPWILLRVCKKPYKLKIGEKIIFEDVHTLEELKRKYEVGKDLERDRTSLVISPEEFNKRFKKEGIDETGYKYKTLNLLGVKLSPTQTP